MNVLNEVQSKTEFEQTIEMMILPKLSAAVASWNPESDETPVHIWLHPWLPLLRNRLSSLYPDIRRKMAKALSKWHPLGKSAIEMLLPWKNIFDRASMDNLVTKIVIPKLVTCLREFEINPRDQSLDGFHRVMEWRPLIDRGHFLMLFEGEFFPRWLSIVKLWLMQSPDFAEVSEWYTGWKSLFPEDIVSEQGILDPLNRALDMMNIALAADGPVGESGLLSAMGPYNIGQHCNYFQLVEKRSKEQRLHDLTRPLGPTTITGGGFETFKELVQHFANMHDIEFIPTVKEHEGRQLWRLGAAACFIDQDVLYVKSATQEFLPTSLDDAVALCKGTRSNY